MTLYNKATLDIIKEPEKQEKYSHHKMEDNPDKKL